MIEHLNGEQISRWALNEADEPARAHVSRCAECRRRIDLFEGSLSGLRDSIHQWSSTELSPRYPVIATGRFGIREARITFALLCVGVLLLMRPWSARQETDSAAVVPAISDDALLKQVSADVTKLAPSGMEALASPALE